MRIQPSAARSESRSITRRSRSTFEPRSAVRVVRRSTITSTLSVSRKAAVKRSFRSGRSRATTKIRRMASDRSLRRARPDRAAALEVLHHPLEALVELDLRHVTQHAPGLVDVRLAVPDVSGPAFSKPPADPPAHEQLEL